MNHRTQSKESAPEASNRAWRYAWIIDMDGTLALMGDRNPYDTSDAILKDKPNTHVVETVQALSQAYGDTFLIVSGRKEAGYVYTKKWLEDNVFSDDVDYCLYMRANDDNRSDDIVKYEIFNRYLRGYNIRGVFDDRPKVCRMWREIGLPVFQVGDPYVEF